MRPFFFPSAHLSLSPPLIVCTFSICCLNNKLLVCPPRLVRNKRKKGKTRQSCERLTFVFECTAMRAETSFEFSGALIQLGAMEQCVGCKSPTGSAFKWSDRLKTGAGAVVDRPESCSRTQSPGRPDRIVRLLPPAPGCGYIPTTTFVTWYHWLDRCRGQHCKGPIKSGRFHCWRTKSRSVRPGLRLCIFSSTAQDERP